MHTLGRVLALAVMSVGVSVFAGATTASVAEGERGAAKLGRRARIPDDSTSPSLHGARIAATPTKGLPPRDAATKDLASKELVQESAKGAGEARAEAPLPVVRQQTYPLFEGDMVAFPRGYREWTRVRSMAVTDKKHSLFEMFGGFHHVYANDVAVRALRMGSSDFPDGSAFVVDLFENSDASGSINEGPRKMLAVMVRARARFAEQGGWAYEAFDKGDKTKRAVGTNAIAGQQCASCHKEQGRNGIIAKLSE